MTSIVVSMDTVAALSFRSFVAEFAAVLNELEDNAWAVGARRAPPL